MAQQPSSRLSRLLTLLDTGSTQATRLTAARQIGEIAKSHPQDLNSLLIKVSQYLRSKKWDTRVAAAHAIGAIAENVKHSSLTDVCGSVEKKLIEAGISGSIEDLVVWPKCNPNLPGGTSFGSFDLNKVLEYGALLASGGQEYDVPADNSKNPKERIARQKQNLRRRLGLDVCEQFMDVNEMIRDEDLLLQRVSSPVNGAPSQYCSPGPHGNIRHFVSNIVPSAKTRRPSARELNLLKRKAKVGSKEQSIGWTKDGEPDGPHSQDMTSPREGIHSDALCSNKIPLDTVSDEDRLESDGDWCWPFQSFVEQLMLDMFDPLWEIRHGSVMALREILTHQGANAGVIAPDFIHDIGLDSFIKDRVLERQESGIDLKFQAPLHESGPDLKKPKIEDASPVVMDAVSFASGMSTIDNIQSIVEDFGMNLPVEQGSGAYDLVYTKTEVQTCPNSVTSIFNNDMVEAKRSFEDSTSLEKIHLPRSLAENCELMNLVKLARHSWVKNSEFLRDCAIRFLCVLSLDRFGDYVSDQVVAPVRETCAQALGAVLKYMHPTFVYEILNILLQMQNRPEWEIRHSSLLGIKYLVAVRKEMLNDLLSYVLPACNSGLEDADDDVRAVSADSLIPTAAAIVSLKGQILHSIVMLLWDILLDLDDLSPSTSSVMNLLAEIYSQEKVISKMYENLPSLGKQEFNLNDIGCEDNIGVGTSSLENPHTLSVLAPRLWPFMRHTITSVRYAAIRTLERLLEAGCRRSLSEASYSWPSPILGDTLQIVFQNLLLESDEEILQCSGRVWGLLIQCPLDDLADAVKAYFSSWVELSSTPYGSPLDTTKMFWPVALPRKSHFKAAAKMRAVKPESYTYNSISLGSAEGTSLQEKNIGTSTHIGKIVVGGDVDISVTQTRVVTATALGVLAFKLGDASLQYVVDPLWKALASFSGVQRQVASMVLISWFKELKVKDKLKSEGIITCISINFGERLLDLLSCTNPAFPSKGSTLPYAELSRTYEKLRNEARQLYHGTQAYGMHKDILSSAKLDLESLSADDAVNFASKLYFVNNIITREESTGQSIFDELETMKQRVLTTGGYLKCVQNNLHVTVSALLAAAVVWMSNLPAKLNRVILPLMASIKREQDEMLQSKAAEALAELIYCCMDRKPGPNDKLIKNICSLTCMDPCETPQAGVLNSIEKIEEQGLLSFRSCSNKQMSKVHMLSPGDDRPKVEGFISRRGAELALKCLCEKFGGSLFYKLPKLWDCLVEVLKPRNIEGFSRDDDKLISEVIDSVNDPQTLINNIQVVCSVAPLLDVTLRCKLLTLLPCIFRCVCQPHVAVRLAACRCITTIAKSMAVNVMIEVVENVIPMLGDMSSVHSRQGAGMLVSLLVQGLGVELVPYAPLLVVPLLRCMSDSDPSVRQSVTHSFATLVPLLPLARGISAPAGLSDRLSRNQDDVKFLEQLVDNSHIDDYKLSINLKVTLRRYQQEGINWLAFLKRFNLHGILCDDMGLGKTLQASAIVASDIAEHIAANTARNLPPSLIICPSTLVGHWEYEIEKFIDASLVTTLQYCGSAQERISLRCQFNKYNVIVTSYDVVRKDVDSLKQLFWNYCVLDEGHIIKNSKSKVTLAVKQLKAQHRLILSGTPIQNNVLDLWSLFDFLMPGFLGTEKQFHASYGKPLLAARDPKCSAKDAEGGALAMEALHKQVMPFLLRRTKEEVLSDLPEKIIQDRYCDLSPVQLRLYEKFSGSHVKLEISSLVKVNESDSGQGDDVPKASSHVFQAIQYLLKLCSHPLLVLGGRISESISTVLSEFIPDGSSGVSELHKLHHSPKLVALQEILEECGIGIDASSPGGAVNVGQHRVLIFAQHKAFLDIIEKDLFHAQMKNVTYLRLDGSVETDKRFEIVKTFNSDPTIDVLLLTTHVGGLGLNLTSADTLVFMEHDWNPMRDHQAMDRAHRLGQKKVVHVHRLIMRGTLEEKVMSLQRFKVSVANAVINADNSSLKTMNTDQLLDLFTPADGKKAPNASERTDDKLEGEQKWSRGGKGLKAILGGLEDLWDQSQYTEEYNLSHFLAKLNG
ncbi:unnamed protein product [Cuscuta epithymum]|uniref:TATA-binding protein-associated factor BTAF1 n=2 Tax=Cuscuta epithymum TaxID=186058 RepID=A0AAV0EZY3_9ASTE|nr:unnamed protein product [Cuscuta epithymum]CAH9128822.1 unnamed protein product [Cuscuta epithymum]